MQSREKTPEEKAQECKFAEEFIKFIEKQLEEYNQAKGVFRQASDKLVSSKLFSIFSATALDFSGSSYIKDLTKALGDIKKAFKNKGYLDMEDLHYWFARHCYYDSTGKYHNPQMRSPAGNDLSPKVYLNIRHFLNQVIPDGEDKYREGKRQGYENYEKSEASCPIEGQDPQRKIAYYKERALEKITLSMDQAAATPEPLYSLNDRQVAHKKLW